MTIIKSDNEIKNQGRYDGAFYALGDEAAKLLLSKKNDQEVDSIIKVFIELLRPTQWNLVISDVWDPIHRFLSGGKLKITGTSILNKCILGGQQLYMGSDKLVSFKTSKEVKKIADAINNINKDWFLKNYRQINQDDYWDKFTLSEEDIEYVWGTFHEDIKPYYLKIRDDGFSIYNKHLIFILEK